MEKQVFQSLTIQGAIVLLLVQVGNRAGIQIGSEELTAVLSALFTVVGFIMTVVGRVRAKRDLKIGGAKL